ncbi:MAG: hypothetical protein N2504_04190 [candidate division WOR-3 bacterium]|nr:hypothetical protein [candidate division WOR-3 bacterium]MCX7947768.1 hypothetical protein [candidate division WOR-3 bacterium]MDW8150308.1 hypothetical protein [candidate division WOR-3 bacterium]
MRYFIIVILSSCIYSLTGFFPREYKDVAVYEIENKTDYLQLTNISKIAFEEYVLNEPRLNLKDRQSANILVKIYISNYSREPEKYDQSGNIISYKYSAYIEIEFLKKDTTKVLDRRGYQGFFIQGSLISPDEGYKFAIKEAINKAFSEYFSILSKD